MTITQEHLLSLLTDWIIQEGPESWPSVQREILDEETKRSDYQEISVDIKEASNFIQLDVTTSKITTDQQITVMLLAHQKQLPDGEFPGDQTRDRVLTDMLYLQMGNNQTYGERINITSIQHGEISSEASLKKYSLVNLNIGALSLQ